MTTTIVDGRKFDWISEHDTRNNEFAVSKMAQMVSAAPRERKWVLSNPVLDQGSEGACVGHGVSNILSGYPNYNRFKRPQVIAFGIYHAARFVDEFPGEADDGTSVLAGMKVAKEFGLTAGYHWANTLPELKTAVLSVAPVAIGVNWYANMMSTDKNGLVHVSGNVVGGHCVCVYGYEHVPFSQDMHFRFRNSWSAQWGIGGDGFISEPDMVTLLNQGGEAAVGVV
jgi:C1A family cysteine protease